MKKLFIFFTLLSIFNSCTSDSEEDFSDLLSGIWANNSAIENSNLSQSFQYDFNPDSTFTVSTIIQDEANVLLGYRYFASGNYEVNGDRLTLNLLEIFIHNDSNTLFSSFEDLEMQEANQQRIFTFSIDGDTLTFTFPPCGPNELCITSQSFQRIEELIID
ncbi:hypothetical protein GTQ40_03310 [Flavobacteriaceae bacterium R38]|nr:hypothetical protein [Flavobacteriaceae bacterium R38]